MQKWKELFSEYKDKRCLITGGAGFIGRTLRKKLIELGAHTWCVDIKDGYHSDVRSIESLGIIFESSKPDYVFHLAALTEVAQSYTYPREYYNTNILGTLNVLEMCRLTESVKRIVCASSDKAYGERSEYTLPYREGDTLLPALDPYSNSKRLMDELCTDYRRMYTLPLRTLRCANTYGPGQTNETTLITNTVLRLMHGECAVAHTGSMQKEREWLYIDDAVSAYLMAGVCDINCWSVWNVGSGYRATPVEIIKKIMSIVCVDRLIEIDDTPIKRTGNQRLDNRLYSTLINAAFTAVGEQHEFTDLNTGLAKTIEWYQGEYSNGNNTGHADCSSVHS
jgi:nucleoside-diphosphate-sugar epimerase